MREMLHALVQKRRQTYEKIAELAMEATDKVEEEVLALLFKKISGTDTYAEKIVILAAEIACE